MQKYLLTFSLLLLHALVFGQQLAQATEFPSDSDEVIDPRTIFFAGQIDDLYHVNVSLLCSSGKCSGTLTYAESGTQFQLEGLQQGNTILLQEIDSQEAVSGFIKAEWIGENMEGEWSNVEGNIGSRIQLQKVAKKEAIAKLASEKWVKIYRGIVLWDEVEMIVHHLGHKQLSGSIYYSNQDEYKPLTGSIDADGQLNISIKNAAGIEEGQLTGKSGNEQSFRAEYSDASGKRNFSSFELKTKIPIGYIEYADYVTSYEILYPEYNHIAFNAWVKNYLKDWKARCRSQVQSIKEHYPVCEPQARASERAYVWFEIEEVNKEWLVGQFLFSNTWNKQTISKPINFNLQSGKAVEWKDVFKKRTPGFEQFKKEYIAQELRRNPRYMDSGFRNWVQRESFPIFTIQTSGIQFSTQYDEVYGQAKVTIPYDQLKRYMKPKTPIHKFF